MTPETPGTPEPGQAEYETWRAAVPEFVCNVPGGPWEGLSPAVRAGFAAIAAGQPQPAPELSAAMAESREIRAAVGKAAAAVPHGWARPGELDKLRGKLREIAGPVPGQGAGCLTPGAVYSTHVSGNGLAATVDFGQVLDLSEDDARELDAEAHDALERVLARHWPGTAGRQT